MSHDPPIELAAWYASEEVRRNLGGLCDAVFFQEKPVYLLGSIDEPLLVLEKLPIESSDLEIAIDEARADWSNVTLAASIYGTRFRLQRRKTIGGRKQIVLAILHRHPKARHPAERYLRATAPDVERLAQDLEVLARDVRRLGHIASSATVQRG